MRNETKEEGKEVQREEGMTTETTVITETVAQEEKIETKATPIEIIKDEKEEKTNHNSQENGGSEGLEKSDEIERRNTSESDDGLLALIASKSNEKDEDITEKVTRFLKEGVDSFSELLSFMKLGGSSTNLEKLVSSGKTACAICPTTEELSGYLLVLVISMIKDCNGENILQLARLTPIDADAKKEGKAGCRYICHEGDKVNAFWEQENRLFTAPVTVLENEEPQLFILEKGISDFFSSQDSRSILSTDSSTTTSSQSGSSPFLHPLTQLEIYQNDDSSENLLQLSTIDATSYADIMSKCGGLITNLAHLAQLLDNPTMFEESHWKKLDDADEIEVFQKILPNDNLSRFLSRVLIPASPTEIKYLLKQSKNREQYDPMCRRLNVIQTIDENTFIVRFISSKYFLNRDFCLIRHDYTTPSGEVYLGSNSVKTSLCPERNYTRGVAVDSGFVILPRGKGVSSMTYIVQANLNIWAPDWLVNNIIRTQVVEVADKIRNYFVTKKQYESSMRRASLAQ